eukprot:7038149-Alexandrium_andersonii.AAC.1
MPWSSSGVVAALARAELAIATTSGRDSSGLKGAQALEQRLPRGCARQTMVIAWASDWDNAPVDRC